MEGIVPTGIPDAEPAPAPESSRDATMTVFRWDIPLDSMPGYILPIEVTDAVDVEMARAVAVGVVVGGGENEEDEPGRSLTVMEKAYIQATEPVIVRDTTEMSLTWYEAVRKNELLEAEAKSYAEAKAAFKALGIDPNDPMAWVKSAEEAHSETWSAAQAEYNARKKRLESHLSAAIEALTLAREETGFAPAKPQPPVEPDYSALTIVADETAKHAYPRLAAATWVDRAPESPLTDQEREGIEQILNDNNGIALEWARTSAGPDQIDAMDAAVKRLKSLVQGL